MRDKVRQQQLQIQMAQLYATEQVRYTLTHHACSYVYHIFQKALDVLL
jgi:hypothetical protein